MILWISLSLYRFGCSDVRQVHKYFLGAMHVEYLTAGTLAEATTRLARSIAGRLQSLASVPQRIFYRGRIPLIAPCLEVRLGSVCQKYFPRGFEIGPGLVERLRSTALLFARVRARIKAAMPSPRILIMRIAAADRDGASMNIPVVDVPAFLAGFRIASAGKLGHVPSKLTLWRPANSPTGWARNSCQLLPIAGVDKLAGGRPCLTFRMAQYWAGKRVLRSAYSAK